MEGLQERVRPYVVDRDPGDETDVRTRLAPELHVSPGGAHWVRWPDGRETGPFYIDEDGYARIL